MNRLERAVIGVQLSLFSMLVSCCFQVSLSFGLNASIDHDPDQFRQYVKP